MLFLSILLHDMQHAILNSKLLSLLHLHLFLLLLLQLSLLIAPRIIHMLSLVQHQMVLLEERLSTLTNM
jgi:hypothetical protein